MSKSAPTKVNRATTVGELRVLLKKLPADAIIAPDWAGGFQPTDFDPIVVFDGARVVEGREGSPHPYLSLGIRLRYLSN